MQFLKQVLASFVGSILAIFIGIFIFVLVIVGAVTGVMMKASHESKEVSEVKPNSILKLDLNRPIKERANDDIFAKLKMGGNDKSLGLDDILAEIKKAKTDDNIKGIYISATGVSAGFATLEAIRNQLLDFKKSGKFVVAYGEVITQKNYYLASAADKVYLNPVGIVEFKGFSTELMFLKNLLDKLEIETQIFYCGKFKSATEPLRYTQMSDANREQITSYLNDVYKLFIKNISDTRKIDEKVLDSLASNVVVRNPTDAKKNNLVDDLFYYDQVAADLNTRVGAEKTKDVQFVSLDKYKNAPDKKAVGTKNDKIAVIYAQGNIVDGEGSDDEIGSINYAKAVHEAAQDKDVKAIVLRVNSGGGSALASDIILREFQLVKGKKPIIVSMGDVAASGGYYIACAADTIVAQPNTITGSIGVFGIVPNLQGFFNNKMYVTFDRVKTGKFSDFGTVNRPLSEEEKLMFQAGVDTIYFNFKSRVAEGRKKSIEYIDSIAQGRVWTGTQAKQLGLVDVLGGLDKALEIAASKAGLKDYNVKEYPKVKDAISKLFKDTEDDASAYFMQKEMGDMYPIWKHMNELKTMNGIQARLLYDVNIQ